MTRPRRCPPNHPFGRSVTVPDTRYLGGRTRPLKRASRLVVPTRVYAKCLMTLLLAQKHLAPR